MPPAHKLRFGLYLLLDDGVLPFEQLMMAAQHAIEGGASVLQARLKHTPDALAVPWLLRVRGLCSLAKVQLVVNDRVDLALLSEADGVHLGDDDLPVEAARKAMGHRLVGRTVRDHQSIAAAAQAGASYVGVGPVFHTVTKVVGHAPLGTKCVALLKASSPIPVVAIGGITLSNIAEVVATKVDGIAVASDFLKSEQQVSRVRALREACLQP